MPASQNFVTYENVICVLHVQSTASPILEAAAFKTGPSPPDSATGGPLVKASMPQSNTATNSTAEKCVGYTCM